VTADTRNWIDGSGNWNTPGNWSPTGVPSTSDIVNIVLTDGVARTISIDQVTAPLGLLSIDLTGPGTTTTTLSAGGAAVDLDAGGIFVGGYSGTAPTNGRAVLNQSSGFVSTFSSSDLVVAYGAGSSGLYNLTGGKLTINEGEFIGLSGNGTFNQSGNSTHTVNASATGIFAIGKDAGSAGNYNLSGGTLTVNAPEYLGYNGTGTFTQSDGTHAVTGGQGLYLGFNAAGHGNFFLSGTGALTSTLPEYIGYNGSGTFNQSGGIHSVNGAFLVLGWNPGSTGTYNLGAGSLISGAGSGDEHVGYLGVGAFTQTGGTHAINAPLDIGFAPDVTSTYTLSGGVLNCASIEHIGFSTGMGVFQQTAGQNTALALYVADAGKGSYTLNAGTLSADNESIGYGGTGVFSQTGGVNRISLLAARG
jgi:hypothetical protein